MLKTCRKLKCGEIVNFVNWANAKMSRCPKTQLPAQTNHGTGKNHVFQKQKTTIYVQRCVTIYISWNRYGTGKKYTCSIKIII